MGDLQARTKAAAQAKTYSRLVAGSPLEGPANILADISESATRVMHNEHELNSHLKQWGSALRELQRHIDNMLEANLITQSMHDDVHKRAIAIAKRWNLMDSLTMPEQPSPRPTFGM